MRRVSLLIAATLLLLSLSASVISGGKSQDTQDHAEWVAESLKEMETIKVGMTRADLLKVFREEGGLSTRTQRQYAYRACRYIKVSVDFEAAGEPQGPYRESPDDKITKISKPFLEWPVLD